MTTTYTVSPDDIASELPGIYPGGFTSTSIPTAVKVKELIDEADTVVTLRIRDNVGSDPADTDRAAPIAKRFIVNYVLAILVRMAYVGRDPLQVTAAVQPYLDATGRLLLAIDAMGEQITGEGEPASRVDGHMTSRCLSLDSYDLDPRARGRF